MGQEKVEAASQSMQAMAAQWMTIQSMTAAAGVKEAMAAARALASISSSPRTRYSVAAQVRAWQAMARAFTPSPRLRGSGTRLAQHGLKPIHARALANAKRLAKG